ncbi:hypothetical protein KC329_g57 [Hortaea werneckii]|nr:hypothetical protein KC329_g57 [Hortaea werneckii]
MLHCPLPTESIPLNYRRFQPTFSSEPREQGKLVNFHRITPTAIGQDCLLAPYHSQNTARDDLVSYARPAKLRSQTGKLHTPHYAGRLHAKPVTAAAASGSRSHPSKFNTLRVNIRLCSETSDNVCLHVVALHVEEKRFLCFRLISKLRDYSIIHSVKERLKKNDQLFIYDEAVSHAGTDHDSSDLCSDVI